MKLTMKQLRNSIRRVLLENIDHYEKITELFCTGTMESVKSALSLCETMGYIYDVKLVKWKDDPYIGPGHSWYHDWTWEWEFDASDEFKDLLYKKYKSKPKVKGFTVEWRYGMTLAIKVTKHAPEMTAKYWPESGNKWASPSTAIRNGLLEGYELAEKQKWKRHPQPEHARELKTYIDRHHRGSRFD